MKKKKLGIVLKRRLHPIVSYAVLFGVGAIAVSATGTTVGMNTIALTIDMPIAHEQAKPTAPIDLAKLKKSATEFASQLSTIKSQVAELEKYGHIPPQALMDAIGQGDQLVAMILQAQTLQDIGDLDPAAKLRSISVVIAANSKF